MDSEEEETNQDNVNNESSGDETDGFLEDIDSNTSERLTEIYDYYPYEVLSMEEICQHMIDCIHDVDKIIEMPATTTRILLHHFKWDKEKLVERLYDGDQEQLFAEARVVNPFTETFPVSNTTSGTEECEICYTCLPSPIMTGLKCGHRFCTQCWDEYLTTKIMEDGVGPMIACAACNILVDDVTVMRLVEDSRVRLKYQYLITSSFVECNRLLRWCPTPDCNNAVKVSSVEARAVTCRCFHTFCFACGENGHDPINCQLLKSWIKMCKEGFVDPEWKSLEWIEGHTKKCPQCNAAIEKNGGCNHMSCKNQNCRAEFCWNCLKPWYGHMYCNVYDAGEANAQPMSRAALERYLFYRDRYMNHMQSLKFEHELHASIKEKMEEMQQYNISRAEVEFLKRAVNILCQCRQTLMYTFAFAYYLKKNNQSTIFEGNQGDLESATETLSEYLHRDITSEDLPDIKPKVLNTYRYCESRRNVLLGHVHEGHNKDWWDHTE